MDLSKNWFEDKTNKKIDKNIPSIAVDVIRSSMGGKIHDIRGNIHIPKNIINPWSITNCDMSNNQ